MPQKLKLQSAIDFMMAYGITLIIIAVALVVVVVIATAPPQSLSCTSPPGFSCGYISMNTSGVVTIKLSQAIGSQILVNGLACSSQQNYTGDNPEFGNVAVNSLLKYYPDVYYIPGNVMYSGSSAIMSAYCYTGGGAAAGKLGSTFSGILWLNYTVPNYNYQIQKVATFTAGYTSR